MNKLLLKIIDNLPPLPETVSKLQQYIDSAGLDVQIDEVVNIISKDPLLTADLLRLANSPYYGFSREISTLNQVISLLGIVNVKNVVVANSLRDGFSIDVSPYGLDTKAFLANCSKEAEFISSWFGESDKKLSQVLVPCAMLLRLGMMLFANSLLQSGENNAFLDKLKAQQFNNISEVESEFFGLDHLTFLGFLFDHWKFDDVLIQSTAYITMPHAASDEVKRNAYALAIANKVFEPYHGGSEYNMQEALALIEEAKSQHISFDVKQFLSILPPEAREHVKAIKAK